MTADSPAVGAAGPATHRTHHPEDLVTDHPLPVGARVRHYGQQWPAARAGTATVREVKGPWPDGSYEYRVTAGEDFSRRTGPNNPETRDAWWSSAATIPAQET